MRPRALLPLVAALCVGVAGWAAAVRARGSVVPERDAPVVVGSTRVAAVDLEAAARSAGRNPRRLAAARRAAADRAIERLWLEGEAAERGLRPDAELAVLRGRVADALVGAGPLPDGARFAAAFDAFHERWRARTRCLADYRDPYEDRCGDGAGAPAGTCRWMGEATLCELRGSAGRGWLVVLEEPSARTIAAAAASLPRRLAARLRHARVQARARVARLRSRADAIALARAVFAVARAARARAEAVAGAGARRAAAARARAAHRDRMEREREQRLRDPRLSAATLGAARDACRRQTRESDPYLFGFGMQDVIGQSEGLIAARTALAHRLAASASDAIDRGKLRPLVKAIAAGSRELARLAEADAAGDRGKVAGLVAGFDRRTEPERAISRRLGLGDCLARPAR